MMELKIGDIVIAHLDDDTGDILCRSAVLSPAVQMASVEFDLARDKSYTRPDHPGSRHMQRVTEQPFLAKFTLGFERIHIVGIRQGES